MLSLLNDDDNQILAQLAASQFRASFHLSSKLRNYFNDKGAIKIHDHAVNFIAKRLAPARINNDGKQTPMKNHPVFIAQHATATCCRGCLNRWYGVVKNRELTVAEQTKVVNIIMAWIERDNKNHRA